MENGTVEKGVCSSESVNGSPDIWSCKDSHSLSIDHLVAMVHGIFGRFGLTLMSGSTSGSGSGSNSSTSRHDDASFIRCSWCFFHTKKSKAKRQGMHIGMQLTGA
ncbi:hypothetical protein CIPAW_10G132400 [Carya illinoinensis]|uniref:Uncharacterized protein n=1 Tax=Carya illinoinensis TaxID=32201 RepID=A0A8T1PCJ6_CARIL|nr:hypothetical protein CIPAW_10G132400 [Carya illinoinensis]